MVGWLAFSFACRKKDQPTHLTRKQNQLKLRKTGLSSEKNRL